MAITNASTLAEYASGISTQGATLTVDQNNKRVGIGTTNPQAMLQVGTGVTVFGNAGIASFTSLKLSGDTDSTSVSTGALTVTGGVGIGLSLTVGGNVSVGGTLTYEDVTNVDSVGLLTARSGLRVVGGGVTCVGVATFFNDIQVGDKIIHTGDTNTALRFPSADTITAETGGTERLRITSAGLVGIGTDSPQRLLHLMGGASGTTILLTSSATGHTTSDGSQINIRNDDNGFTLSQNENSYMNFRVNGSERLRIDANGKICISHTNALHSGNLQVATSSSDAIDVNAYSSTAANGGRLTFYRSKNASIGSNTVVADNDSLGRIDFRGYNTNGNAYNIGATIEAEVDGAVDSATDMPSALVLKTSADGSASPTERVRITSAGLVGIGSDAPVGNLDIRDTKANLIVAKDGLVVKGNSDLHTTYDLIQLGAGGALASYSTATATADTQFIHNAYRHSGGNWKYRYADTALRLKMNSPANTFIFENAASGSADADITWSEKLRITSSGHMGLGVTPSAWPTNADSIALQIGTGFVAYGRGSGDEDRGGIAVNYYNDGSNEYYIGNGNANRIYMNDGNIDFQYASTNSSNAGAALTWVDTLRIDTGGRLLAGTTSYKTNLNSSADAGGQLAQFVGKANDISQCVGIFAYSGTSNPTARGAKLQLNRARSTDGTTNTAVAANDLIGTVEFKGNDATNFTAAAKIDCFVDGSPGTDDMPGRIVLSTSADGSGVPTERLRISSEGDLTVKNHSAGGGIIIDSRDSTSNYGLITGNANRASAGDVLTGIRADWNSDSVAAIYFKTGADTTNKDDGEITFHTQTSGTNTLSERFKIASDGVSHFGGDVKVLSGDISMGTNRGISFNASEGTGATSSLLDDYEEGDFTPTCEFGSGGTLNMSLGTALGRYTKIGRVIRCEFTINFSQKGDSTGGFYIASLPFASQDNSRNRMVGIVPYFTNVTSIEGHTMAYGGTPATRVPLYDATNGSTIINQGNINDDTLIRGVVTYNCN